MGEFLAAAEIVLRTAGVPLSARGITDRAFEMRLLPRSNGTTPHQTMKAKLSVDIRTKGDRSKFMRTGPGKFFLRRRKTSRREASLLGSRPAPIREFEAEPPRTTSSLSEHVLVVPATAVEALGDFHGFNRHYTKYMQLLSAKNIVFVPRRMAEVNPSFKQLLSYVLIRKDDQLLRYVRGRYSSAADVLKGRLCVGFGGHINVADAQLSLFDTTTSEVERSVFRELNEELVLPVALERSRLRSVGVINDQSSIIGDTHFAFVYELDLSGVLGLIAKREKAVNQLRFVPIDGLGDDFAGYEYWSKLCINALFASRLRIEATVRPLGKFRLRRHDVVVIIGSIGSGKTEAARLLEERFGSRLIATGSVMSQLLGERLAETGRAAFQERALAFIRAETGPETLAAAIMEEVTGSSGRCVIDGVRNLRTLEALKRHFGARMAVMFVDSSVDNSFKFYRTREDPRVSFREFVALLNHPVEVEVPLLIRHASVVVYNYGSKRSYMKALNDYFGRELESS